jgi:hypothetical protein
VRRRRHRGGGGGGGVELRSDGGGGVASFTARGWGESSGTWELCAGAGPEERAHVMPAARAGDLKKKG